MMRLGQEFNFAAHPKGSALLGSLYPKLCLTMN